VLIADLEQMHGITVDELGRRLTAGGRLDLVFSINIAGNFVDRMGRPMIEVTGAPHVVQYVDYPLHDLKRFTATSPGTALLFVDPSHVRTVEKLFGPDRFAYLAFSPHGAVGSPRQSPGQAETFVDRRPIPVLFAGTYYRPNKDIWNAYPIEIRKVFWAAVDIAMSAEWISPLDALDLALTAHGLDPNGVAVPDLQAEDLLSVRMLASQVQEWVRTERRERFLAAAARAGLPLTMVGKQCDEGLHQYANIDYRGPVEIAESVRLMQSARLLINLNGNFGRGSHERPFTAMVAGAAVASDYSTYYAQEFEEGREIALFRWTNLENDLAKIADLARNPKALFEMARAGQAKAMAHHRWDNRIDSVLEAARAASAKALDNGASLLNRGAGSPELHGAAV
jgi:hypothetical protein